MDAIKKQASKLREQVAKQQQAVLRQFSGRFAIDPSLLDEPDAECHQQLQTLYKSTKAAKYFQRNILRGLEGLIAASSRQMEITSNLANACFRFGENENSDAVLAKSSLHFGNSHRSMEEEREKLHKILAGEVYEPIRSLVMAAPLEDARHLAYCYEKLREEAEAQAIDVARRQLRSKEAGNNPDYLSKLQNSEKRLHELRSALTALGREATSAMKSVETDQRKITFQKLLTMVDAERSYHHNVASLLDKLREEMILVKQKSESEGQADFTAPTKDFSEIQEHLHENHIGSVQDKEINGRIELDDANGIQTPTTKEKFEKDGTRNASGIEAQVISDAVEINQCPNLREDHAIGIREQGSTGEIEQKESGCLGTERSRSASGVEAQVINDSIETNQSPNLREDHAIGIQKQGSIGKIKQKESGCLGTENEKAEYFIAEVIHSFDALGDGELNLSVGDFVVVRQESENGWSEGECKGEAGWFPAAYVERCDKAPADRVMEPCMSSSSSLSSSSRPCQLLGQE